MFSAKSLVILVLQVMIIPFSVLSSWLRPKARSPSYRRKKAPATGSLPSFTVGGILHVLGCSTPLHTAPVFALHTSCYKIVPSQNKPTRSMAACFVGVGSHLELHLLCLGEYFVSQCTNLCRPSLGERVFSESRISILVLPLSTAQ